MKRHESITQKAVQSDEDLVRIAQSGNQDAFVSLYERFFPTVFAWVRFKVPENDVEDVTQEVFIAVMKSLHSFRGNSKFSTWIWTLANHKISDYHRKSQARWLEQQDYEDVVAHKASNHREFLDTQDDMRAIQRAMQKLPENYQEVLRMRFIDEMPFQEMALKNGQTLEATKSLFRRALVALTDKLEKANG